MKAYHPKLSSNNNTAVKIPVLMYHHIEDFNNRESWRSRSPYFITTEQFRQQMFFLRENNYKTLTLDELYNLKYPAAEKLVVITFDDGYKNNYHNAFRVLLEYGLTATFFVIVNKVGLTNYLSWNELQEMADQGMAIQSHTLNHIPLTTVSMTTVQSELGRSKLILEQRLGKAVHFVSYPHGAYNEEIIKIVQQSGYRGSCNSEIGYYTRTTNPFKIKRIDVRRYYDLDRFVSIIQNDFLFLLRLKVSSKFKQQVKKIVSEKNYNYIYQYFFKVQ